MESGEDRCGLVLGRGEASLRDRSNWVVLVVGERHEDPLLLSDLENSPCPSLFSRLDIVVDGALFISNWPENGVSMYLRML